MSEKSYFPICPLCGFHAEMYYGVWQTCSHQKYQERKKEIRRFVQKNIKMDYTISFSRPYEIRISPDGIEYLQEVQKHVDLEEAEQTGLFCMACGGQDIDDNPMDHAEKCMEEQRRRMLLEAELTQEQKRRQAQEANQQQERTDVAMDKADDQNRDAEIAQAEAESDLQAMEEEEERDEDDHPEYYEGYS